MDPQIRNFKDFLSLYNKITHLCFSHCVDNFYSREISEGEAACVDKCLLKFTHVNQRVMNVYVEVQTAINTRRIAELVGQQQEQAKLATTPEIFEPTQENSTQFSTTTSPPEDESER